MNLEVKSDSVIRGEPWSRLYNPLVMDVFREYSQKKGKLFGMTGDLDNLGIYVARNGRPAAENLVDLYNQTTRNFLEKRYSENKSGIRSLAFVPAGEESLIIGVSLNSDIPRNLFEEVKIGIMELMVRQQYLDVGQTSITFGGKIFDDEFDLRIKKLVNITKTGKPDEKVYPLYLEILTEIRRETSIALDRQKFKNILGGDYPIELRQLVLTRMLLYKRATKQIVESLNQISKEDVVILLGMLGDIYGIEPGKEDEVDIFLNRFYDA